MMKQQQTLLALLIATISQSISTASAFADDKTLEKRRHLRSRLLRGANSEEQEKRKLDASLSDFTSSLNLYQMDTSEGQPFDDILPNGSTGTLLYSPSGWDFRFAFMAQNLPTGTAYQLVAYYPDNTGTKVMSCLGSGTVGGVGGLLILGTVPLEVSLSDDDGAKVWLALDSDVNCSGGGGMEMISPSDYNKYMFPKDDDHLEFDYLGDGEVPN